jgi:hypothetical protein
MNLDEILGSPGAESILIPEEKKPSIFAKDPDPLTSIIDTTGRITEDDDEDELEKVPSPEAIHKELESVLNEDIVDEEEYPEPKATPGRKKVEKSGLTELVSKLIEKGQLQPFDDDKPIDEYSLKDFEDLLEANFEERENSLKQEVPKEFFESLPPELQYAAAYAAEGGRDMKNLFKILSQVEETKALDPEDPRDSEIIVRKYLGTIKYGTDDEIEDEILRLKDREELSTKAFQFKPKLDAKEHEQVAKKLAAQEAYKKQQQNVARKYMSSIFETLKPGEVNGIKLDKKIQGQLYAGLTEPNYPTANGSKTNLLGHLLEKYQYIEPRHDLIAEALWLLADPDGYKAKIQERGKTQSTTETVKKLKTAEQEKNNASTVMKKRKLHKERFLVTIRTFLNFKKQKQI